jgi:glycosyltransferase involved in cell wall biosynthesis
MSKVSLLVSDLSTGGTVRAYLLALVLRKMGYGVEVIGFQFGKALYAEPPEGVVVRSLPGHLLPGLLFKIPALLKLINGDYIYAVKPKPMSFGIGLLKRWQTGKPLLLDMDDWELSWCGGDDWQYKPGSLKQRYRDLFKPNGQLREIDHPLYVKWLEKWVDRAHALTVDTNFLQKRFGGVYLPNGKETGLFDPSLYHPDEIRSQLGLSNYRLLMFPGAPRPHKGVEDVLEALEFLNQEDLRVVIIGGSPYDDYDDRLKERYGKWIIQLPRTSVEKMPGLVAAAHVIIVPQRDTLTAQAQFPLKLTDGMAMAKPILSTNVGDIPEILGDTGYLVEPQNPKQIAIAIEAIFSNWELAEQKGKQGRDRCLEHYGTTAMSKILTEVFESLPKAPSKFVSAQPMLNRCSTDRPQQCLKLPLDLSQLLIRIRPFHNPRPRK